MKKAKQAGDPPRRYKTGKKAALQAAEEAAAAAAAAAALNRNWTGKHTPNNDVCIRNYFAIICYNSANVAIQGNSQIQTGKYDVMSSQDTFNSISRQNSYIPPTAQQLPHMYNMSQSTPASSQQPIDNGNTLIGTSNGGFGQPEFNQLVTTICQPTQTTFRTSRCSKMQQQQQQQQQQQMPTQQRFSKMDRHPTLFLNKFYTKGKCCLHNHQMIAIGHLVTHKRIAILQLTQQQKNHERCNYKNLAHS